MGAQVPRSRLQSAAALLLSWLTAVQVCPLDLQGGWGGWSLADEQRGARSPAGSRWVSPAALPWRASLTRRLPAGVLRLLEHGEEYVFTLPSAYARSILTLPWVELGGKVSITCAKTGYSATVIFHTKPFYGGKVHR